MNRMLQQLVELLRTTSKDVTYLRPLVELGRSGEGVTIATLNYDLSIEQAAADIGCTVHTGIEEWASDGRWRWPADGVRLLKMHGSIDWAWSRSSAAQGQLSRSTVVKVDDPMMAVEDPALVFGQGSKLKANGPFLALLAEFELQLSMVDELVVVGYSFRDEHINEVLRRWLTDADAHILTVIDPWFCDGHDSAIGDFAFEIRGVLGSESFVTGEVGPRLRVIRKPASEGLRQCLAAR
jgi:hypothetical protein